MVEWGILIATYLFLGGLAGGLFASTAALDALTRGKIERTAKLGALISWISMAIGLILLLADLGRPEHAFRIMLAPHMESPMAWGAWVIVMFTVLGLAYWLGLSGFGGELLKPLRSALHRIKDLLGALGSMFGLMTAAYTGILLGFSRLPLWRPWALPLLFTVSGIATGYAVLTYLVHHTGEDAGLSPAGLSKVELTIGVIELLVALLYVATIPASARGAIASLTSVNGILFWLGFVAIGLIVGEILLPAISLRTPEKGLSPALVLTTAALVLIGGYILRYAVLYAGQVA